MPTEFKIPELGENVTAGDVVRVMVKAGDTIAKDQPILELETDKATIEVPSSVSGTVKEIKVKQGDKVNVGQTVLTVDDDGGAAEAKPAKGEQQASEKPTAQPEGAAEAGGMSQAAPGKADKVAAGGDKAAASKGAAERGRGTTSSEPDEQFDEHTRDKPPAAAAEGGGKQRPRGEVVDITRGSRGATAVPQPAPEAAPEGPAPPAAPSVRRLARELGVDIRNVAGTGSGGRISTEDLQSYVRNALSGAGPGAPAAAPGAPLPDFTKWGEVERKPMSGVRRKTSEHMAHAWNAIPHVTQHDKADITALEALRKRYSSQVEKAGGKLTVTAIALKIVGAALRRFPQFNASVDSSRSEIIYKSSVHVGVAVDTERGLLVPVVRDADRKGIADLSVELAKLSEKARGGKLSLEEMQGGSFTITNLGGIGGTLFTPIVNWPEVAILGISRGAHEPVYNGSQFEPRLVLPLSLSYDHRVINGADAARFLRWVAEAFEQPFVLSL
jgi:pyruvate dehydrogenase E2 component (dihydrolipoamide acetyltransferase)